MVYPARSPGEESKRGSQSGVTADVRFLKASKELAFESAAENEGPKRCLRWICISPLSITPAWSAGVTKAFRDLRVDRTRHEWSERSLLLRRSLRLTTRTSRNCLDARTDIDPDQARGARLLLVGLVKKVRSLHHRSARRWRVEKRGSIRSPQRCSSPLSIIPPRVQRCRGRLHRRRIERIRHERSERSLLRCRSRRSPRRKPKLPRRLSRYRARQSPIESEDIASSLMVTPGGSRSGNP